MFTHKEIWTALDSIATKNNLSTSGLAKKAGLDPTAFNKSKRESAPGKYRWPSTESLSKALSVVGMNFEDFAALATHTAGRGPSVPVIGLAQAGSDGFFDDAGYPVGEGWDVVHVPGLKDENVYALEVSGDSMAPVLRHGDRILVAPNEDVRKGDRVVVKTADGEILAKELAKMTSTKIDLISLNPEYDDRSLDRKQVQWIARIVWASQ